MSTERQSKNSQAVSNHLITINLADIRYAVFEGGGVNGAAYNGALRALAQKGVPLSKITRVAGTSAGAISACIVAMGFSIDQIDELTEELDEQGGFAELLEEGGITPTIGKVMKSVSKHNDGKKRLWAKVPSKGVKVPLAHRIKNYFGIYGLGKLHEWLSNTIKKAISDTEFADYNDLTFEELGILADRYPERFKRLHVVTTNLTTCYPVELSDSEAYKTVVVADAVCASSAIPLFFQPCQIRRKDTTFQMPFDDPKLSICVDGGIVHNCPQHIFDKNCFMKDGKPDDLEPCFNLQTIVFRLNSPQETSYFLTGEAQSQEINGILAYGSALFQTLLNRQNVPYSLGPAESRTVFIDPGNISFVKFNLTTEERDYLIARGQQAVEAQVVAVEVEASATEEVKIAAVANM